jgi:cyanophycin synthetase
METGFESIGMTVRKILALRGPNVWARVPVLEVWVEFDNVEESSLAEGPAFRQRLASVLGPALASLSGTRESLLERLREERALAEVLALLLRELQILAGSEIQFHRTRSGADGLTAKLAVQFQEEEVARGCLDVAIALVHAARDGLSLAIEPEVARLRELAKAVGFGPNTAPVVAAARARGIPVRRLNSESLIQLGYGAKQRRFQTAVTDRTSAIAEAISQDKDLTKEMLRAVGVPVPEGRPVSDADDAWSAADDLEGPVVVKPRDADHGDGITMNLTTREQVLAAYEVARAVSGNVMVERYAPGAHHRLLIVDGRVVAAARRDSAHVVGDGSHTIAQLLEQVNRDPRRGDDASSPLRKIAIDEVALAVLAEQGCSPDSVPADGTRVLLRRNSHMKDGGDNVDVTDRVHPEVAARALDAARVIGLDLAGLDVVVEDISRPLEEQGGVILEVNANPWLRQHLRPWHDPPRPVGEAIVDALFPNGEDGRIPIIAVTGTSGKTTTTRLIAHLLTRTGRAVGMSTTDGIYIEGRRIETGDCSGPQSARIVLLNPTVEVAVLETAQGGIIREGLAFDRCDVTVVTNLGEGDHLELRGIDTLAELALVKRTAVEAVSLHGAAVLKADDPLVAAMAEACAGDIIWFSRDADQPILARHRLAGKRAAFVRDGAIVLAEKFVEEPLLPLAQVPMTHDGRAPFQVENVLAATAAVWSIGLSRDDIRAGLQSFLGDPDQMPARFNVFQLDGATVIVDFPHNAPALLALIEAVEQFPHNRRTIVFAGCNRRDADVVRQGEILGDGFDRVILYLDQGNRDRKDGELNALLRQGLASGTRMKELIEVEGELLAIDRALGDLRAGDLLVLGVERIEESLAHIQGRFETNPPAQR